MESDTMAMNRLDDSCCAVGLHDNPDKAELVVFMKKCRLLLGSVYFEDDPFNIGLQTVSELTGCQLLYGKPWFGNIEGQLYNRLQIQQNVPSRLSQNG
ncbi:hypothetical protein JTB14_001340 [Gonioctena quinquepunctata]|nr:hypothetical protein JTB14_001340 [Gonioctena quinquepunctata]